MVDKRTHGGGTPSTTYRRSPHPPLLAPPVGSSREVRRRCRGLRYAPTRLTVGGCPRYIVTGTNLEFLSRFGAVTMLAVSLAILPESPAGRDARAPAPTAGGVGGCARCLPAGMRVPRPPPPALSAAAHGGCWRRGGRAPAPTPGGVGGCARCLLVVVGRFVFMLA